MSRKLIILIALTLVAQLFAHEEIQFLADNNISKIELPNEIKDIEKVIKGVFDGISVFSNLPHQATCNPADPVVAQDVIDIANLIKNVTVSNLKSTIEKVIARGYDAYTRIAAETEDCKAWAEELANVGQQLGAYFSSKGYAKKLGWHTLSNIVTITSDISRIVSQYKTKNWYSAGNALGTAARFVAFWDFKPTL